MDTSSLGAALEAVLFASGDSVEISRLCLAFGVSADDLLAVADSLREEYERSGRGIRLLHLNEKLQLVSAPEWDDVITQTLEKRRASRLSSAAMEALSVVAYYQPVTRAYIDKVRGVDSSYTVSVLLDKGLIAPCGVLEAPGRPTLFGTTEQFLRVMGISSLKELPQLPELQGEGLPSLPVMTDVSVPVEAGNESGGGE